MRRRSGGIPLPRRQAPCTTRWTWMMCLPPGDRGRIGCLPCPASPAAHRGAGCRYCARRPAPPCSCAAAGGLCGRSAEDPRQVVCLTSSRSSKCPRFSSTWSCSVLLSSSRSWRSSWWKCRRPPLLSLLCRKAEHQLVEVPPIVPQLVGFFAGDDGYMWRQLSGSTGAYWWRVGSSHTHCAPPPPRAHVFQQVRVVRAHTGTF